MTAVTPLGPKIAQCYSGLPYTSQNVCHLAVNTNTCLNQFFRLKSYLVLFYQQQGYLDTGFNYLKYKNREIEPFFPQAASACILRLAWLGTERMVDELVDVTHWNISLYQSVH